MGLNGKSTRRTRRDRAHIEALEPRWMLSAVGLTQPPLEASLDPSEGCIEDVHFQDIQDSHAVGLEAPRASAQIAPSQTAAASIRAERDLGAFQGQRVLAGSVGWYDTRDTVQFALTQQSTVQLGLSGLQTDIDLYLYDANGQLVSRSIRGGRASESISRELPAGVYTVSVTPWLRWSSSRYQLSISIRPVDLAPAPAPQPAPAPVTSPTPAPAPPPAQTPAPDSGSTAPFPNVPNFGGTNEWNLNLIGAPEVWAQGYDGAGVTVAVVDTGVDLNHPDLFNTLWVNPGEIAGNGFDDDQNGFVDDIHGWDFAGGDNQPQDFNGHGTHVAGTVAAANNGFGATGVAPGATIMPIQVLGPGGSGSSIDVSAGIRYAVDSGADIVNLSLGGGYSAAIRSALQYAQQAGVLVVAAAGNEAAGLPAYPAVFSASLNNVVSVGAHSSGSARASFSNRVGSSAAVQVDAPGVSIFNTYAGARYARLSGTSMASPHVAGVAALALSAQPNLSATALRQLIVNGANRTVQGSDARGGVNAAMTVALAAAFAGGGPVAATSSGNSSLGGTSFTAAATGFPSAVLSPSDLAVSRFPALRTLSLNPSVRPNQPRSVPASAAVATVDVEITNNAASRFARLNRDNVDFDSVAQSDDPFWVLAADSTESPWGSVLEA